MGRRVSNNINLSTLPRLMPSLEDNHSLLSKELSVSSNHGYTGTSSSNLSSERESFGS